MPAADRHPGSKPYLQLRFRIGDRRGVTVPEQKESIPSSDIAISSLETPVRSLYLLSTMIQSQPQQSEEFNRVRAAQQWQQQTQRRPSSI